MARASRAIVAAAVLFSLLVLPAVPSLATFPGNNGKIAYRALRAGDGEYRIYIRSASGGPETPLTSGAANASDPVFTADGQKIAFEMSGDIWIMWSDGSHKRNLTDSLFMGEYDPAFSPNGRWIAWYQGDKPTVLRKMRLDGTQEQVVASVSGSASNLSWSPDGKWFATQVYRGGSMDLMLIEVATGEEVRLTRTTIWEQRPDWAPDGSRLVYSAGSDAEAENLFTIKPDGTGRIKLTSTPDWDESHPAWSPNGRRIVFVQRIILTNARDLATMRPRKDAVQTLVGSMPGDDFDPAWQPVP